MVALFLAAGGSIFATLGIVHGLLTLTDIQRPRYFAPKDDAVRAAMMSTTVRFSRGRANLWDAWLGFNLSHSLGLLMFGAAAIWLALNLAKYSEIARAGLIGAIVVSLLYFVLSLRFWFRTPAIYSAIGTACFAAACWSY